MNQKEGCSLIFTGDIAFSGYFKEKYDHVIDEQILRFLDTADEVVANVEAPITTGLISGTTALTHVNDPRITDILLQMNSHIWNLGNNHIMDCGEAGVNDTLRHCSENGAVPLGIKDHYYVIREYNGIKIGIITVTRPWSHLKNDSGEDMTLTFRHPEKVRSLIAQMKERADRIIAVVHGGDEFLAIPLPDSRRLYHSLLDYGADVVVGHHPHVVQNYEEVNGKIIFYSLGNCIFDTDYQHIQNHTETGMLVKLTFTRETFSWENMPVWIDRDRHIIRKGADSPIFTNIGAEKYRLLWPLAAGQYIAANRAAEEYRNPKLKQQSRLKRFAKELRKLKKRKDRLLVYARIFSAPRLYSLSKEKGLIRYLKSCGPASD